MALIEVRGLTKHYRMGESVVRALDGVDLDIERGEFVAITGASGSGKSTIMHLLGCLDRPTSGAYRLDGRDVSDLGDRELAATRNHQIGFVFQTFNLINRTSALENVGVPLFYARKLNTQSPALRALERVGLADRARHNPNELSGGERQRVAIARAMVNDPVLLLADEPTGNLDSRTGEQIMDIFRLLNEQGVTIVMVTHEPDIARQAKRVIQMRDGRIVSDQAADESSPTPTPTTVAPAAPATRADGGAATAVQSRPDVRMAAAEPAVPDSTPATDHQPPTTTTETRRLPGATGALVCSLIGPVLFGVALITALSLRALIDVDPNRIDPRNPPLPLIVAGLVVMAGNLGAIIMGIVTLLVAGAVLRRARREPAAWRGLRRVRWARVLGWLALIGPLALIAIGIIMNLAGGEGFPGRASP